MNVEAHPLLDSNVNQARDQSAHYLSSKQDPWPDFHVLGDLQITRKVKALSHRNEPVKLEHHIGNWFPRPDVTSNKLCDDVQANVLVGDSFQQSLWNEIEECNQKSNDEPPPR